MLKTISALDLNRSIHSNNPPVVLEALPARYYEQQHLPGARLFPHDQVEQLAPSVLPNTNAAIVVYCASRTCQNSHLAAHKLRTLGYSDVAVYEGGKADWEANGLPFETSQDSIQAA